MSRARGRTSDRRAGRLPSSSLRRRREPGVAVTRREDIRRSGGRIIGHLRIARGEGELSTAHSRRTSRRSRGMGSTWQTMRVGGRGENASLGSVSHWATVRIESEHKVTEKSARSRRVTVTNQAPIHEEWSELVGIVTLGETRCPTTMEGAAQALVPKMLSAKVIRSRIITGVSASRGPGSRHLGLPSRRGWRRGTPPFTPSATR
jgi:hypothetical protein